MAERPYPQRTKVLYIGGTGRTGSTVLTRLLGELAGWFAGGELAFLWRYGLGENGCCSCGQPVPQCPIWSVVLDRVTGSGRAIDADRMVALRRRCWSVHLPIMLSHPVAARRMMDRLEEFPDVVAALYQALAEVTGSAVIVDSSKEPHYSWILRERTDLDLYFLHLVRDPRAVAHSWSRRRRERGLGATAEMERRGSVRASLYYDVSNIAAEAIWRRHRERYAFLRYEDLVGDPAGIVDAVAAFVEEPIPASPLDDGGGFTPTQQHIAWGNPNRFEGGRIELAADDAWRRRSSTASEVVGVAATWPVARRYGYEVSRSRPPRPEPLGALRDARLEASR